MRRLSSALLLSLMVACSGGGAAETPASPDGAAAAPRALDASSPDKEASPGAGGTGGAAGAGGTGGNQSAQDARPAPARDAGAPTPKAYPSCASGTVVSGSCGAIGPDGSSYVNEKKDGWICRLCKPADAMGNPDYSQPQRTGCVVGAGMAVTVLCVSTCGECSF